MIRSIHDLLTDAGAPRFHPDDTTLSSGERAHARIVAVLAAEWDTLDGKQQRALTAVLEQSTRASEDAEAYVTHHYGGNAGQ